MNAQILMVTPEMAEQWLKLNTSNRRLRRWWAEALAAAMRRGEWLPTHQGIAFAVSGHLIDGQHRLIAIIKSGIAQQMLVVHGVPDKAFSVLDIGAKRSASDTTGLNKRTAEACRYAGSILHNGNITPQQIMAVAASGLGEVHDRLIETCGSQVAIYTSAPMRVGACMQVMDGHSDDYVFSLYRKLAQQHLEDLPPIAYSFVRQVGLGKIATTGGKPDLLARALKLYNPDYQSLTRIQIGDGDQAAAHAMVRSILKRSMAVDDEQNQAPRSKGKAGGLRKQRETADAGAWMVDQDDDDAATAQSRQAMGARGGQTVELGHH